MANGKLLGCWGAIVGLVLAAVLGWMTLEVTLTGLAVAGEDGVAGPFLDALFLHELGELLVVGAVLTGIYVAVLRPGALSSLLAWTRPMGWVGGALQAAAWWGLAGTGLRWWAAVLVVLAVAGPAALRRLAEAVRPAGPSGTPPDLRT